MVADIARQINPLLRGWIEYYGRYMPSALGPCLQYVNQTLQAWVMRKFKSLKGHKTRARLFLMRLAGECPGFFAHWKIGRTGSFARWGPREGRGLRWGVWRAEGG